MRIFSDGVLITAPNAGRLLCRIPTGKNTARRAAKRCTAGRKTRAQESTKRTIRGLKTPCFQGLFDTGSGYIKELYQPLDFGVLTVRITKTKGCSYERKLVTVDAETLLATPMSKTMFIVDGLIPQGVNVLSGAAKIGKSWLMLWLGLQVSQGLPVWGIPTMHCDVLYLCLEDTQRRIKDRLFDLTNDPPKSFHLSVTCGLIGNGLEEEIINFLEDFPKTKLVIIDTLQKVRDSRGSAGKTGMYGNDYDDISAIKKIADERDISIILVHHLRKLKDGDDPFNEVSGSTGITGAADTNYVLKRKRSSRDATLLACGRDVEYQELTLRFQDLKWELVEHKNTEEIRKAEIPQFLFG